MKLKLGQLQQINLREAWKNEASEFTPWLAEAENLNYLADALGLQELELVQTEYPVGDFKLDILCSDDDGAVIIENQLEKTDHTHLGQIITYAAGIGAKKIIWIAERFRSEHIAALEFLNQNTTETLNFFAVEIILWKIGDSAPAPSFNVVAKPNDWSKFSRASAKAASEMTPTKQWQLRFWTEWVDYLDIHKISVNSRTPRPQHWMDMPLGRSGFNITATVNSGENRLGVEIYIHHQDSKSYFAQLEEQKNALETALGFALDWQELPNRQACRIVVYKNDASLDDENTWGNCFAWLASTTLQMDKVFRPIVKKLT